MSIVEYFTKRKTWYLKKLDADKAYLLQVVDYGLLCSDVDIIRKTLENNQDAVLAHIKTKLANCFKENFNSNPKKIIFLDKLLTCLLEYDHMIGTHITLPSADTVYNIINTTRINAVILNVVSILEKIGYDFDNYDKRGYNFIGEIINFDVIYPDELYDKLDILIDMNQLCNITYGNNILEKLFRATINVVKKLNTGIYNEETLTYRSKLMKRYIEKTDKNYRNYDGQNVLELCHLLGTENNFKNDICKNIVKLLIQHGYTLSSPNNEKKPSIITCNWTKQAVFTFYLECGYDFTTPAYLEGDGKTWLDVLFEHSDSNFGNSELYNLLVSNGVKHDAKWYVRDPLLERLFRTYKMQHAECDICAGEENVFFDKFEHKMCLGCIQKLKKCQQCQTIY